MDILMSLNTWIIIGILLSLAEIFIPGGILLNLGIAALIVALGIKLALLDTWVLTLTTWFIASSFLLFALYFVTNKFFKGDERVDNVYEELDIYGKEVVVTEKIGPGKQTGRVEYQGTSWTALSDGSEIEAGSHVTIVCKDNISLVVEAIK